MSKRVICAICLTLVLGGLTLADVQWTGSRYSSSSGAWDNAIDWVGSDSIRKAYHGDGIGSVSDGVKLSMEHGKTKIAINNNQTLINSVQVEMFEGATSEAEVNACGVWNVHMSANGANVFPSTNGPSKDSVSILDALNITSSNDKPQFILGPQAMLTVAAP